MSTLVVTNLKSKAVGTPPKVRDDADAEIGRFCRAWINFNGTGTVAIRDSFNVSSLTDIGVGVHDVNFLIPLPNANYAAVATCNLFVSTVNPVSSATSARLVERDVSNAVVDVTNVSAAFFSS